MIYQPICSPADSATLENPDADVAPQVLVVDDTRNVREFMVMLLRISGYRPLVAEDGLAAQRLLQQEHPLVVISDLQMPRCDGWELLAYCHEHHPEAPVMIVSSETPGRRPEIERWAASFIRKPFDLRKFIATVDRLASRTASRV